MKMEQHHSWYFGGCEAALAELSVLLNVVRVEGWAKNGAAA